MTLKQFTIDFQELAIDVKVGLKDYSPLYKMGVRLKDFLLNKNVATDIKSGRTPSRFNEDYWNGDYDFLTMSDVDTLTFSLNKECSNKITDYAIEEERTLHKAKENSLIISNAMTLGLSFLTDRPIYINQNVFEVNLDETKINKKFLLWYFNLIIRPLFQTTYASKYLSKDELGRIKIPLIPKTTQDQIVAQIEPIEQKIKDLKKQIKEPQEIINKVFAREFGFDLDKLEELKKEKFFEVNLSTLSISKDIRSATKFHNSIFDFLLLSQFKKYRFKDFIKIKKTTLGRQIQPEYFEEESKFYYVGPNSLKSFLFDSNLIAPIKKEFFVKNQHLQVEMNDILLVASGEGSIGKSAIYNDKIKCITSQFVMKINFIDKSVVQYFHFYMQSSFFQLIVEKYKKGMGNMTNIFVSQLVDFPVLFSEKHKQIVDEIKAELDKQEEIKQQIEQERNKIDENIEMAIV